MSMRWDPLLASAAARALNARLGNARVRALLMDSDSRRVALYLRERTLVFELHPLRGWLSLLPATEPPAVARRLPARVRAVEALPDESAIVFSLPRVRGREEGLELILEMVGNQWNAVALGHRTRTIRHVLVPREGRTRTLAAGTEYRPPESTGRAGSDGVLPDETWERTVSDAREESTDLRRAILRGVAWTSSLNVSALLGANGAERWRRMVDPAGWEGFVLETDRGPQPYPIAPPGLPADPAEDLLDAFRVARERDEDTVPAQSLTLPPALLSRLEDRLERARGKARGLKRELERARDPEPIRSLGDLILARYGEIPRGRDSVELTGFDGEAVEVELDPTLTPDANAARYYDEAARIERAREELPARIRAAESDAARWEELTARAGEGDVEVEELEAALGPERSKHGSRGGGAAAARLPYRRFRSSGGLEIRVGRGARSNDDLTFHHSAPDDIWLHVRQSPGAHVVLRWTGDGSPPRRDLAEAANLAALHSSARHSGSVAVGWTRRKHVRKPRKASPGSVTPDRMETVFVTPEPKLLERLAVDDS